MISRDEADAIEEMTRSIGRAGQSFQALGDAFAAFGAVVAEWRDQERRRLIAVLHARLAQIEANRTPVR